MVQPCLAAMRVVHGWGRCPDRGLRPVWTRGPGAGVTRRLRIPRIQRPGVWFIVAILLAAGAFVLTARAGSGSTPAGRVLVARVAIPAGTVIDTAAASDLLALAPVPDDLGLSGLVSGAADAMGRRTVAPLGPGEPITQAALGGTPGLGPEPLASGERAVPVPLRSAGGSSAALSPGARVDVLASDGEGPSGRTRVVVADAEVLAITAPSADAGGDGAAGIVLRLSTRDALAVTQALDFARQVRVITRPPGNG